MTSDESTGGDIPDEEPPTQTSDDEGQQSLNEDEYLTRGAGSMTDGGVPDRWPNMADGTTRRRLLYILAAAVASVFAVSLTSDDPAKPGEKIERTFQRIGYGKGSYGTGEFGE